MLFLVKHLESIYASTFYLKVGKKHLNNYSALYGPYGVVPKDRVYLSVLKRVYNFVRLC